MGRKIVTIVGARPQFVKVAPVSRVLRTHCREVLVNTGQHYDYKMAGVFFEELSIPKPDYDLGVGSGNHGKQTGEMLNKIEEVLLHETPDAVLVYGDTNSTLAGALAASKLHIPIFHVEAGLRSFNKRMPEEINRIVTDHVSDLLFPPTETAVRNLQREGVTDHVFMVGDVMHDAVLYNVQLAKRSHSLETFGLAEKGYYLATIHRADNTDDRLRLKAILEALRRMSAPVVLPLHPRTQKMIGDYGFGDLIANSPAIRIIEPVSYLEMLLLENGAKGIITDSGGVQKEAYFARVPCFTLRDETEWVETVESGWNTLVNPLTANLAEAVQRRTDVPYIENLYGDGNAASKIVDSMMKFLAERRG